MPSSAELLYTKEEVAAHIQSTFDHSVRFSCSLYVQGISYDYYANTKAYDFSYCGVKVARFRNSTFVMWL